MSSPVIEDTPDGLRVSMRAPRAGCLVAFLTVWFIGWTYGGIEAIRALFSAESLFNPLSLFLLLWLAGWLAGELFVAALLAFMIDGQEVLEVDGEELRLRAEAFGRAWTRRYALTEASNLRPVSSDEGSRTFLAFDFRGKTVRFGTDLNETATLLIAQTVWDRAPSLRPLSSTSDG